jgi:hypothetical protein
MDKAIGELKKKALSGSDIKQACSDDINVYTYSDLSKFMTIDDAFGSTNSIALLYETKPGYGHWVGLFRHPSYGTIEFFDSYGNFIDSQLRYVPDRFKHVLGEDYPYLSKLMLDSDYHIIFNPVALQKTRNDVSSCGRHVVMRCNMSYIPLDEYITLMRRKTNITSPDQMVTYLTAFI